MSVPLVPRAAGKVGAQLRYEPSVDRWVHKAPRRVRKPSAGLKQNLRPAVIRLAKPVRAVQGDRHGSDFDLAAKDLGDGRYRRVPASLGGDHFGGVLVEPEAVESAWVAGEDDNWPLRHSPHLAQPCLKVLPLVNVKDARAASEHDVVAVQASAWLGPSEGLRGRYTSAAPTTPIGASVTVMARTTPLRPTLITRAVESPRLSRPESAGLRRR